MKKTNYYVREQECEDKFHSLGNVYNANTPENHPLIFTKDDDFKAGMTILGICCLEYPDVKLYAFQLMSNHFHAVLGGSESRIQEFFGFFASRLGKYFETCLITDDFKLKLFPIDNLAYLRNAISYVNRNGFVVNDNVTPFSYPWGSGSYFFQPMVKRLALISDGTLGVKSVRTLMHSRYLDHYKDMPLVDGYICPLLYCDIESSEHLFRDAKHYFYLISRNVESFSEIAKSIGETVFYSDSDLFLVANKYAKTNYGTSRLSDLDSRQKIELAKKLHYDYNAGDKQLQRLLRLSQDVVDALFA